MSKGMVANVSMEIAAPLAKVQPAVHNVPQHAGAPAA